MDEATGWDGPYHGRLGVLADDGQRAQCHICGNFYGNLGGHVTQSHGIAPDEYKAYFGLNATTGLVGPDLRDLRVAQGKACVPTQQFANFAAAGAVARANIPAQRRSNKGKRLRLQLRRDPKAQAARLAALARANEVLRERKAAGLHKPTGWGTQDPREVSALGHRRLQELRQDPNWREAFARRVSAAKGGKLKVTCTVCGAVFTEPYSHRRRKTCSAGCLDELRARNAEARKADNKPVRAARRAIGVALGVERRRLGISISDVGRLINRSASHISRIDRGLNVPSPEMIASYRTALDAAAGGDSHSTSSDDPGKHELVEVARNTR